MRCSKYPTAAFAAVGAPKKPFHSSDLGTPCCETKVRALRGFPEDVRIFRYTEGMTIPLSLSRRGQITLPKEVREKLGLRPGDVLLLKVEEGRLVLEPALLLSYEVYSEERLEEFRKAAEATPEEVAAFLEAWGLE